MQHTTIADPKKLSLETHVMIGARKCRGNHLHDTSRMIHLDGFSQVYLDFLATEAASKNQSFLSAGLRIASLVALSFFVSVAGVAQAIRFFDVISGQLPDGLRCAATK